MAIVSNYLKSYLKSYVTSYIFSDSSWFNNSDINIDGNAPLWISEYNNDRYALSGAEVIQSVVNTLTRATVGSLVDHDGLIREAEIDELRLERLRRVDNLVGSPTDMSSAPWATSGVATATLVAGAGVGGRDASDLVFDPSASQDVRQTLSIGDLEGKTYKAAFSVKGFGSDIGKQVKFSIKRNSGAGSTVSLTVTLTADYVRYTSTLVGVATDNGMRVLVEEGSVAAVGCRMCDVQVEDVTAQSNQNPASFVDGSDSYIYENANTVSSNVVTEAHGSFILDAIRFGYLNERAGTNLLTYSAEFDNAAWLKNQTSITANAWLAPDANLAGDDLIPNANTTQHYFYQNSSVTNGVQYVMSLYAKSNGYDFIQITGDAGFPTSYVNFNLATGATATISGAIDDASIDEISTGLYRISLTLTATASGASGRFILSVLNSDIASRIPTYLANGTSGVSVWGAQFETGFKPTSYIATTSGSATRSVDKNIANNLDTVFDTDRGVIYWEGFIPYDGLSDQVLFRFDDGSFNNVILVKRAGNNDYLRLQIRNAGIYQVDTRILDNIVTDGDLIKIAVSYELNNVIVSIDGATAKTDTVALMPIGVDNFLIGSSNGSQPSSTHAKAIRYYNAAGSEDELNRITAAGTNLLSGDNFTIQSGDGFIIVHGA